MQKKTALNNKNIIIKNKDIDYIDANHLNFKNSSVDNSQDELIELPTTTNTVTNHKEEFLEDKLCLSSSEFYNNSSFFNDSFGDFTDSQQQNSEVLQFKQPCSNKNPEVATRVIKDISEYKELRYFYPISEEEASMLNFKANREFDTNFTNQLLLKVYIKYPEKRFKNKFTFSDYMIKTLKGESHQAPQVNNPSFRFSCNIGTEEKNILEYEKYLNQIENSFDTSKEMCVKKKIAGRFSSEVAYKILTEVEFKKNYDNSFVTALIPSSLALSERQTEILSDQLEAVYGINRYYVKEVDDVGNTEDRINTGEKAMEAKPGMIYPTTKSAIVSNSEDVGILTSSRDIDTINENTTWRQIRQGIIEELGEAIDKSWFSKAVAAECIETKTLTLTMPTRFMADWIRNNYSHLIRRFAEGCGIKRVEYGYDTSGKW